MNKVKAFIMVFSLMHSPWNLYCSYTILDQLKSLRSKLQNLLAVVEGDENNVPLRRKIQEFFDKIHTKNDPLGIVYELFEQAGIIPSIAQADLNREDLTPVEKASYAELFDKFAALLQEIDQSERRSSLRTLVASHLEEALKRYSSSTLKPALKIKNEKIQKKISMLLSAIDDSHEVLEIYRTILESMRELPLLPQRDEPIILSSEGKELLAQHAAIIRKIKNKSDGTKIRERYVEQLKNAYSNAIERLRTEESEIERKLPSLPDEFEPEVTEPDQNAPEEIKTTIPAPPPPPAVSKPTEIKIPIKKETSADVEPEQDEDLEEMLKKAVDERRKAIGEDEDQDDQNDDESWDPWD